MKNGREKQNNKRCVHTHESLNISKRCVAEKEQKAKKKIIEMDNGNAKQTHKRTKSLKN